MGSNPTASATRIGFPRLAATALAAFLTSCSTVPGETTSSGAMQRDVRDRVLALARKAEPQCRQHRIVDTEMLEVHGDGKAAEERWTVDQCGRRVDYIVSFPPRRATGQSLGFSVRPER